MKNIFVCFFIFSMNIGFSQEIENIQLNETKTYEVTATLLPNNLLLSVWMEARPVRKVSSQAGDMRVAYKFSKDLGSTWSPKKIIDNPETLAIGNPFLKTDNSGNTYLIVMNVNKDFFSGNLPFYHWNPKQNEFDLKSIPVSSENTLLDKPALTISNDTIFLIYMEYTKMLENSYLKLKYSTDRGKTWSASKKITDDQNIYLGPSLQSDEEHLFISFGTHWNKKIYFLKAQINESGKIPFQNIKTVAKVSDSLGSAMTELSINKKGYLALGWFYNHKPNEIYLMVSKDKGENWTKPFMLSTNGNLPSFTFDGSGNLLCLYSEFKADLFSVVFEKISIDDQNSKEIKFYLKNPSEISGERDYIGAFQKIIHTENGINLAFWIDYSNENKLYFSKWK